MAFTRRSLTSYGLSEEQVEKVMALHGTSMADFVPKADVKAQIEAAVAEARKAAPAPDIKGSEEYKALQGEFDGYRRKVETSGELKQAGVKDKFIDAVYSLLEPGKPVADQLAEIHEQYEEYFDQQAEPNPAPAPQFGGEVKGQLPSGKKEPSFGDYWHFGRMKGE